MLTNDVSIFVAFFGGIASFISPCVVPLVPSYLSYITGVSFEEFSNRKSAHTIRWAAVVHSLMFILGFAAILIAMGASATAVGRALVRYQSVLAKIGGVLIVLLGLYLMGFINPLWLNVERRIHLRSRPTGLLGSVVVGMTFAAGWTPCIGPILGAILVLAGSSGKVVTGLVMLTAFSLGLALPFFVASLAINSFISHFEKVKKYAKWIQRASGVLLIAFGILLFTNYFSRLTAYLATFSQ